MHENKKNGSGIICSSFNTKERVGQCYNNIFTKLNINIPGCLIQTETGYEINFNNLFKIQINNEISSGHFGNTYLSDLIIYQNNKNISMNNIVIKIQENSELVKKEVMIAQQLSNIVVNNKNPHFMLFYKSLLCDKNIILKGKKNNNRDFNTYSTIIIEKADGTVYDLFTKIKNMNDYKDIITQIILSVYSFHKYTNLIHGDAHADNFLYQEIKENNNKYMKYSLNNKLYIMPTAKYLIHINDYGLVSSSGPIWGDYFTSLDVFERKSKYIFKSPLSSKIISYNNNLKSLFSKILDSHDDDDDADYNINNIETEIIQALINNNIINLKPYNLQYNNFIHNRIPYILDPIKPEVNIPKTDALLYPRKFIKF